MDESNRDIGSAGPRTTDRYDYFTDVQLWPLRTVLDPLRWLSNFSASERPLANRLLEGFVYYSEPLVSQMFRATFANISQFVVRNKSNHLAASTEWARFLNSVKIVRVTGEQPNDTDSGYIFSRLAKHWLGFNQSQTIPPEKALELLIKNPRQNIVFVDDFVGSGNQFRDTWTRYYPVGAGHYSFKTVADASPVTDTVFYAPVICTEYGKQNISKVAPNLKIVPAHLIGPQYSVLSANSIVWREDMAGEGPQFVEFSSRRAGIPDRHGEEGCWRGFHELGLAIAFSHGWPDATIPLFYFDQNGWKPLIRKG